MNRTETKNTAIGLLLEIVGAESVTLSYESGRTETYTRRDNLKK